VQKGVNPLGIFLCFASLFRLLLQDFLIDISSVDNRDPEKEELSSARVKLLTDAWHTRDSSDWAHDLAFRKKSVSFSASEMTLNPGNPEPQRVISHHEIDDPQDQRRPGFWRQISVLTARAHRNVYRNVPQILGFASQSISLGVIIGVTFYQLPEVALAEPDAAESLMPSDRHRPEYKV